MSETQIPVVCILNDAEFRERERLVLSRLKRAVLDTKETDAGYIFGLDPDRSILPDLGEFIELESQCCPFLEFILKVEPGGGNITLELSGPEGTKEFIAAAFLP